jgi:hypothetical protein
MAAASQFSMESAWPMAISRKVTAALTNGSFVVSVWRIAMSSPQPDFQLLEIWSMYYMHNQEKV